MYLRRDQDVNDTAVEHTSAKPPTGTVYNPCGQPTRTRSPLVRVCGGAERREIGGGVRAMPRRTHASDRHRHGRHGPDKSQKREHPYRA